MSIRIYKSQGVVGPDNQIVLMNKFIEEGFPASH